MQPGIARSLAINGYVSSKDTFSMVRMTMVFKLVSIFMQFAYTWKLCELLETYDRRKRSQGEPEGLTETSGNESPLSMILYNSSPFLSLT